MDFKVRCVKDSGTGNFITGKIYTVKDGIFRTEKGHVAGLSGGPFQNVDEINMRLASEFELVEEEKMFTKDDLKAGYVVEHRNGDIAMVAEYKDGKALVQDNGVYTQIKSSSIELICVYTHLYRTTECIHRLTQWKMI